MHLISGVGDRFHTHIRILIILLFRLTGQFLPVTGFTSLICVTLWVKPKAAQTELKATAIHGMISRKTCFGAVNGRKLIKILCGKIH